MRFLLLCFAALFLLAASAPTKMPLAINPNRSSDWDDLAYNHTPSPEFQKAYAEATALEEQNKNLAEKLEAARAEVAKLRESERANGCSKKDLIVSLSPLG